jgi:hypothetical protein
MLLFSPCPNICLKDTCGLLGFPMIRKLQFITGIILALIAAAIMFEGTILGENTTSIALVVAIVGIILIATSKIRLIK